MSLIATHSGLRGRPGVDLTAGEVERAVARLIQHVHQCGSPRSIGVGRDERRGGEELATQVTDAALACGMDVFDFGVVSTPGAKLASRRRKLGAAVVITGSHLAPELNGLKLIAGSTYGPIDVGDLPEPAEPSPSAERGRLRRIATAADEHVAAICASVDVELIRAAGLAVGCRGGAGPAPALLLSRLGCEAGTVSRDLCLHLDPDGDQLLLEDERGVAQDPELTFPLTLEALNPAIVVKGADTSRIVDVLAGRRGATVLTVRAGEIHLVEAVALSGADLAGEGNGGVIVPTVGYARDGLAAAAGLIGLLARHGGPLSALVAELPPPFARHRSTVPCAEPARARACLEAVGRRLGIEVGDPHTGVRVESGNGAWGLVRLSATEPVLRVTAEAETQSEATDLHAELRGSVLTAMRDP